MINTEFWLTDSGIPYDVDSTNNSIIINANHLTTELVADFEALILDLFAAVTNDNPGQR